MSDLDPEFTGPIEPTGPLTPLQRLAVLAIMEDGSIETIMDKHRRPEYDLIVEGNVIRNKRRDDRAEPPCFAF